MLLLGTDEFFGGGLADGFGEALSGQRMLRGQDPIVQRLPRVHLDVDSTQAWNE